jgi:hypothetical protein
MSGLGLFIAVTFAAGAPAAQPVKLAALGFTGLDVPAEQLKYYSDHFAQLLAVRGLRVVTQGELAALIGLDRQKQLLGCAGDNSSCTAEITAALGVDGLVMGALARAYGDVYQLDIKVIATGDRPPLSVFSKRVEGSKLFDELEGAADHVAADVLAALRGGAPAVKPPPQQQPDPQPQQVPPTLADRVPPPAPSERPETVFVEPQPRENAHAPSAAVSTASRYRPLGWIPLALAVISVTVSVPELIDAAGHHNFLTNTSSPDLTMGTAAEYAAAGNTSQTVGIVALSLGLALAAVGTFLFIWLSN